MNGARLDPQDSRVAVTRVGDDAGLRAGERDGLDACRAELLGEDRGRDQLAGGRAAGRRSRCAARAPMSAEQRVGGVRIGRPSDRRDDRDDGEAGFARVAHSRDGHRALARASATDVPPNFENGDALRRVHAAT